MKTLLEWLILALVVLMGFLSITGVVFWTEAVAKWAAPKLQTITTVGVPIQDPTENLQAYGDPGYHLIATEIPQKTPTLQMLSDITDMNSCEGKWLTVGYSRARDEITIRAANSIGAASSILCMVIRANKK